ncbi:MAG: integrin alpha [Planctomycetota bacterium]|nr:integrin alpha [Planctomycetota bacterium]
MKRAVVLIGSVLGLSASAVAQAPLYDFFSLTAGEQLGSAVAGAGDVNGDGFGDIAIGAERAAGFQPDAGVVRIYSGVDASLIRELKGELTGDRFGHAIESLGDVDNDGVADLLVGAPLHDAFLAVDRGAAYIYSGATGVPIEKLYGNGADNQFGWSVTAVPDVNFDGVRDFAVGAPREGTGGFTFNGTVRLYSGATRNLHRLHSGAATGDRFGYSIDGAADTNGDGRGDLVVGAPQADAASIFDSGRAYRISGAPSGTATLTTYSGSTTAGWLGHTVAAVPDANGDLIPDIAVGEPFASIGGVSGSGRIRMFSGTTGAVLLTLTGSTNDNYGWVMAAMQDFDGDGRGDLLVGSPFAEYNGWTNAGLAHVHSGATGALLTSASGYYDGEGFGDSVADLGDVNGDGFHDVIFGSAGYNLYGTNAGRARTALGNAEFPSNYCTAKVNSAGCTPFIGIGGCASASVGQLQIVGVNVLPNVAGLMIWSHTSAATPYFGSQLCVGGPIRRTPVQVSIDNVGGSLPCDGVFSYYFSRAQMAAEGFTPGSTLYAQYWHRDSGFSAPNNFGLTNGVSIPILP